MGTERAAEDEDRIRAVRALARASSVLERASSELSLAHYRVLAAISSGSADRLAVGKPTISAAVEALERRGLLERLAVEGDQRAATLRLTVEGELLLHQVEAEMTARLDDLCGRVADPARLLEALVWLGEAIDSRMAERHPDWTGRTR
jgi:DNA-binding MarR family transcriptional regulator